MKKKKTVTIKIAVYLILVSVLSNILIFGMNYLITQEYAKTDEIYGRIF